MINNFGEEGLCEMGLESKDGGRRTFKGEEMVWVVMG